MLSVLCTADHRVERPGDAGDELACGCDVALPERGTRVRQLRLGVLHERSPALSPPALAPSAQDLAEASRTKSSSLESEALSGVPCALLSGRGWPRNRRIDPQRKRGGPVTIGLLWVEQPVRA